jgi:Holliday junction resolvase
MLEKEITNSILRYLKTVPNCFCFKEHGGMYGTAGVPDILACIDGRFFAFEVKTEEGKLTKLQEATIGKILAAGGKAFVVRSVGEVRAVLKIRARPPAKNKNQNLQDKTRNNTYNAKCCNASL